MLIKKAEANLVILALYVDDIFLTWSDDTCIHAAKNYLLNPLNVCDLGSRNYFLGIEFVH